MSREANVSILIKARDLTQRTVTGVRARFRKLKSTLFSVQSAVVALGGTALVGLGKKLFNLGAEAEEVENRFRTVFGNLTDMMQKFVDDFAAMSGISDVEGKEMIATMGQIAQAMGFSREESAEFSKQIFKTAADLASFTDVPTRQALEDIQSGLAKMPRPLRKYGIMLSQAKVQQRALEMSGKAAAEALTEQERATATLALVTEQAGVAIGDNVRTQDSAARAAKTLSASISNIATSLGTVVKTLTASDDKLTGVRDTVVDFDTRLKNNIATVTAWTNAVVEFTSFVVKTVAEVFRAAFNVGQALGNAIKVMTQQLVGFLGHFLVNPLVDMLNGIINTANEILPKAAEINVEFARIDTEKMFGHARGNTEAMVDNARDVADSFTRTADRAVELGEAVAMARFAPGTFAPGTQAELPGQLDVPGSDESEAQMSEVRKAGKELRAELEKIERQNELLGDSFNAEKAELKALESAIEKFAEQGANASTVIDDQGTTVGDLVSRYNQLSSQIRSAEEDQARWNNLQQAADRITQRNVSAQDKYNEKQRLLDTLLRNNLITTQTYNSELQRMQKQLLMSGAGAETFGQKIGAAILRATESARSMDQVMADMITGTIQDFGRAIEGAFKAFVEGSASAGEAFISAMGGAVATVARKMGEYFFAQGLAALGMSLVPPPLGTPTGAASAAKFFAAGAAMFALSGAISGATSGGGGSGGGGGTTGASTAQTEIEQQEEASDPPGQIIVEGGLLDMSDPRQARRFSDAVSELTGRNVIVTAGDS